jgi:signal transduction histidine kinase
MASHVWELRSISILYVTMYKSLVGRSAERIVIAIWAMMAMIFALDILTPPEIVAVCIGYAVPIFLSIWETKRHTLLYTAIATVLSLFGAFWPPAPAIYHAATAANIGIAILVQWLVALLVRVQRERLNDAFNEAERQRRFINIVSHEVGSSLTVIAGQSLRLAKLSAPPVLDDLKLRIDKIRMASRRIELLVERIRLAASFESDTFPIERRTVDLRTILLQVVEQLREENQGREVELDMRVDSQVIQGDEMLLRQMFENIITNSLKYSLADEKVKIILSENELGASVKIIDHGRGISPQDISHIGAPYYRGSNSAGVSGTGIGLYVVQKIVDAHGGRMAIDSKLGVGTSVTIDLPHWKVGPR